MIEFGLIVLTVAISMGIFLFTHEAAVNYYQSFRYIFYEDYLKFRDIFSHFSLLFFITLRVLLPLLGIYFLLKKLNGWLSRLSMLRMQFVPRHIGMRLFHVLVIVVLLLLAENYLLQSGYTPGCFYKTFRLVDEVEDRSFQYSDSVGVIRINPKSKYVPDYFGHTNTSGFRSKYELDSVSISTLKKLPEKLVMFVGDSYTEGFSAMPRDSCFVELIDGKPDYTALNFGMAGTDPLQYQLVTKKYVPTIKPDAVAVYVYYNDLMQYDRIPMPEVPMYYYANYSPSGNLIASQKPVELGFEPNDVLRTQEDAYEFYKNYCSLPQNTFFGRLFSKAALTSVIWGQFDGRMKEISDKSRNYSLPYTYHNLKAIQRQCDSLNIPVVFFYIPHVKEISEPIQNTMERYAPTFRDLPVHYISKLTIEDHVSTKGDTHFNNRGHAKYAQYVVSVLDSVFANK